MSDLAIKVDNLSKRYKIGARKHRHDTLRDHVVYGLQSLFFRNGHSDSLGKTLPQRAASSSSLDTLPSPEDDFIWAVKDVSFDIKKGEVVGFVGRNGAGKSTLLKILSRITEPTSGRVEMFGRVGSLLEVGTGFHAELTGRENIYLSGAILGMKRGEINNKFDEIVAFSEIEKFIDTPVKRYSSGMYVRLAFAVAAHLEPEILIVDEVLAVGDASFQRKCLGKMGDVAKEGRTVLFVSHNTLAVQRLCERAIWLESGQVKEDASCGDVVETYLRKVQVNDDVEKVTSRDGNFVITKVTTRGQNGQEKKNFFTGEDLRIELDYECTRNFPGAFLVIGIANREGSLFAANMCLDGCRITVLGERGKLSVTFKELPLAPQQQYSIQIGGRASNNQTPLFKPSYIPAGSIRVIGSTADISLRGEDSEMLIGNSSSILVPYEWDLGNGHVYGISSFKNVKLSDQQLKNVFSRS